MLFKKLQLVGAGLLNAHDWYGRWKFGIFLKYSTAAHAHMFFGGMTSSGTFAEHSTAGHVTEKRVGRSGIFVEYSI